MPTTKRDYYEILGIQKGATADEVKQAYRGLALKFHPDRVPAERKKAAEEQFKEVSEAYAVLSDPQKRAQYDQFGHAGIDSRYSAEDLFRGADFSSIFGQGGGSLFEELLGGLGVDLFGGGGRARRSGPRRGSDLEYRLDITFEEAFRGVSRDVTIPREESCGECHGDGAASGTKPVTCPECKGRGQVVQSNGFLSIARTCGRCRGTGRFIKTPCPHCRGQGRVSVERRISVKVPPGVDTGTRLRIGGEGEAGVKGGPRGDLYVYLEVEPHAVFERHGNDLVVDLPIGIVQAALGAEVEVPTLNGKGTMKVPPGTQSHQLFRLRGKGMPDVRGGGAGDLHVRLLVETPTKLSAEQKRLLQEFARASGEGTYPQAGSFMDKVRRVMGKK